jgi:prepilin-type N-terminal cleavage/methylation domain-containing protein/prepilin-type processing-associated H-X9-DG protein
MRTRLKLGFTLVELLVVIAIIGILVALLLPAVQAAREAARRMQCNNRMKQIGLALHNYHDTHKTFPPAAILGNPGRPAYERAGQLPGPYHHTWTTFILPFLEQQPLYDQVDFRLPAWGQPIVSTLLSELRCPSDAGLEEVSESSDIAWTNYPGTMGYHWWAWTSRGSGVWDGVFNCRFQIKIARIKDGTSNVAMVIERHSRGFEGPVNRMGAGAPRRADWAPVFCPAFLATSYGGWPTNEGGTTRFAEVDGSGAKAAWSWFRNHTFQGPTAMSYGGLNSHWYGFSSQHPGGANHLFADGSVHFVAETMDWIQWCNLQGISDGLPAEWQ